ncbi:hypothetical protein ACFTWD_19550 [Streptomyces sp. NPDC056943]|uniref:hypothetical protein n=1 Tax=Streptomyces sp. NPDC056943 TaxID=3345971 RepID=UPI00362558AC
MTKRVLCTVVGGLLALGGLAAFLVLQGLDEADKWSSVLSLFFTVAGFALALAGFATRGPAQSADHAVTGGSLHQVRNVTGDVVITAGGGGTSTPPAPAAAPAEGQGGGTQSAHGARTAGDLHQIDGVGGAVRIEPPTPDSAS